MARNEHDANRALQGEPIDNAPDLDTAALLALQAEREAAQAIMRERTARRFAFA